MIYLRKFDNHAAYEAAKSSLILPNVSLITENNKVEYNPLTPPAPSHDYVEIGGIKWATMNIGANSVTDYGNYYMYGKGADDYSITSGDSAYEGDENPLAASADTAVQVWGDNWRTPTEDDFNSLIESTNFQFVEDYNSSGINGGLFTDKTDNSKYIFLPASSYISFGEIATLGENGYYHSSTAYNSFESCYLTFDSGSASVSNDYRSGYGYSVRPILDE